MNFPIEVYLHNWVWLKTYSQLRNKSSYSWYVQYAIKGSYMGEKPSNLNYFEPKYLKKYLVL